jgi:hypothetical protein
MKTLFKIIFIFFALSAVSTLLYNYTDLKFGKIDFFMKHGWLFLISISLFPRLTLLISGVLFGSVEFGGLVWWLGFFFAPRLLVAALATMAYWHTNPILVILAWLVALGGESSEKIVISRRMRSAPHKYNSYNGGSTIDAEYKVKE